MRLHPKHLIDAFLLLCLLGLVGSRLFSQTPPLPGEPVETRNVKLGWDPLPFAEYYRAEDTNGQPVAITFRVYHSTNVAGPYSVAAVTTNHQAVISNLTARTHFFYVTSSNFFLESEPSELLSLPYERVTGTKLLIE